MIKVWYGEERKGRGGKFSFQEVPLFFLKYREQIKTADEDMIYGGFVSVGQLRRWARFWLWLKKISEIKVWR